MGDISPRRPLLQKSSPNPGSTSQGFFLLGIPPLDYGLFPERLTLFFYSDLFAFPRWISSFWFSSEFWEFSEFAAIPTLRRNLRSSFFPLSLRNRHFPLGIFFLIVSLHELRKVVLFLQHAFLIGLNPRGFVFPFTGGDKKPLEFVRRFPFLPFVYCRGRMVPRQRVLVVFFFYQGLPFFSVSQLPSRSMLVWQFLSHSNVRVFSPRPCLEHRAVPCFFYSAFLIPVFETAPPRRKIELVFRSQVLPSREFVLLSPPPFYRPIPWQLPQERLAHSFSNLC